MKSRRSFQLKIAALALGCTVVTCRQTPAKPTADPNLLGLRIVLPPKCVVEARTSSQATILCDGRVLLFLESNTEPMATASGLQTLLAQQGATKFKLIDSDLFAGVSYDLGAVATGRHFLAVKNVESRRVFCSTETAGSIADIEKAISVCQSITFLEQPDISE